MNNNIFKGSVILGIIIIIFCLGRCSKKCEITKINVPVTIPAKDGSFESPQVLVPIESKEITKILYKDSLIYVPTVNSDLMDKYIQTQEELDKLKLYADAIKINNYKQTFNNDDLELTIEAKTEGKLLNLKPSYTIKSKSLTLPIDIPKPKSQVFAMNVGASIQTTKDLSKLDPAVNLQLINKKGSIIGASYSVDGVIGISYTIPLFKINK